MQLPKNTVPSESHFLAPFFAAAGKSSVEADARTPVSRSSGEEKFDDFFDGLKPAAKSSATPTPAELASLGLAVCPPPTAPTAEVAKTAPDSNASLEGTVTSSENEGETVVVRSPADGIAPHGRAIGHSMREARAAVRTAREMARENHLTDPGQNVSSTSDASGAPTPEFNASEVGCETPRSHGLPEAALEHRNAPGLPPGLTRLLGVHSPTSAGADIATEAAQANWDVSARPSAGEFLAPGAMETSIAQSTGSGEGAGISAGQPATAADRGNVATKDASALSTESMGSEALLEDESAELKASGSASTSHAAGREIRTGGQPHAGEQDLAESSGGAAHERRPLSMEVAHRLHSVSSKRPFPEVSQMAARIAATLDGEAGSANNSTDRSFVSVEDEPLGSAKTLVGTGVANHEPDMFSRSLPASVQPAASDYSAAAAGMLENASEAAPSGESLPVETVNTAHEAVEVVLKAVDHASSQEQKSVNLRFSVGDLELSVRVELQASQVRTTFRTDSAELRAALSQEWEALTSSQPGERTLKLVPAFVTASEQSAMNSFSGDASARQRDPRAERESNERAVRGTSKSRGPAVAAPVASLHAAHADSPPLTSRRLHTVA